MPAIERLNGESVDLSPRVVRTATVAASPAAGTETIIASITLSRDPFLGLGVLLLCEAAFTVGTDGVSANLRIRRTDASGTVIKATGATTVVATNLRDLAVIGFDTGPTLPGQVYVATLTIGSGSAASTVSAVDLIAIII